MNIWLIHIVGIIACAFAGILVNLFLRLVFKHKSGKDSVWIGILERILIYTVITLSGEYSIVGWVLGAKAVARFARAQDQTQSGIYFIGTLLSLLLGLAIAISARSIATIA